MDYETARRTGGALQSEITQLSSPPLLQYSMHAYDQTEASYMEHAIVIGRVVALSGRLAPTSGRWSMTLVEEGLL